VTAHFDGCAAQTATCVFDGCERLRQERIECFAVFETLPVFGGFGFEIVVREGLERLVPLIDARYERTQFFDVARVFGSEDFYEKGEHGKR